MSAASPKELTQGIPVLTRKNGSMVLSVRLARRKEPKYLASMSLRSVMIPENFRRCLEVAFADPGELAEKIAFLERSVLEPARANVELESLIAAQNLSNKRYAEAVAVLKALGGLTEPSPV